MIFGRPPNLILGAIASIVGFAVLVAGSTGHPIDPAVTAGFLGVAGAIIAVIAYQPPTLSPGDTFNVSTPAGMPNFVTTVATPPAADPAPTPTAPVNPPKAK